MRIGVDFGGTSIKAALVEGAQVLRHAAVPTGGGRPWREVLADLGALVRGLHESPQAVGVAIPGEVDEAGNCHRLPNVHGFDCVPLGPELRRLLGCPVCIENDATAAAHAEHLFGWGRQHGSFLLVTLGTGVGGGLVLQGRLVRGRSGFAGEIGHVLVDSSPGAWPCGCGLRGCMEAYAGAGGLLRAAREAGSNADSVAAVMVQGGLAREKLLAQLAWALGTGLAGINNTLDLDALVFTGGIANSLALLEPSLREALRARSYHRLLAEVPVLASRLGEHAGVIGAAWLDTAGK